MIIAVNTLPDLWAEIMLRATVQGAIAVGIVFAIGFLFSRYLSSKAQCWLWRLVFIKLLLLAIVTTPFQIPILPAEANNLHVAELDTNSSSAWLAHDPVSGEMIEVQEPTDTTKHGESTEPALGATARNLNSSYSTLLFGLWITGVAAFAGWLTSTWLTARKLRKNCVPINDSKIHQYCHELCTHFGIKAIPNLLVSRIARSPLLVGNFNPGIVFPAETLESLDDDQLKLVIAHELSHLKRRDLWWSWIPTVVQILFFFHPLVWAARARWLLSREMACDELVLSVTGKSATSYANALINVSSCIGRTGSNHIGDTAFGSTCMVQTSFSLTRRIQAMKNFTKQNSISLHTAIAFGLTAMLVVIPWQPVQRQVAAVAPAAAPASIATPNLDGNQNLNFEETNANGFPTGWGGGGKGYELTSSPDARTGESCGQIQSIAEEQNPVFGTFTNGIRGASLEDYHGKRVRLSGYLRSDMEAKAWAGMWMRVDVESKSVAFDNMNSRPVKGKTDWTEYSVVLDVPETTTNINYGFLISGRGTLWGDDLKIEVVGNIGEGPETTGAGEVKSASDNLDFEEIGASGVPAFWGGGGQGYKLTASPDAHRGESCGQIQSIADADKLVFGTFTGQLDVEKYLGKRVRYSGYLRSDLEAKAWAGMWMRVDVDSVSVAFDNMGKRPVKDRTDWTEYEIVLDVPEDATNINFGFLMGGAGTLWGDDLKFEVVGNVGEGPDATDMN